MLLKIRIPPYHWFQIFIPSVPFSIALSLHVPFSSCGAHVSKIPLPSRPCYHLLTTPPHPPRAPPSSGERGGGWRALRRRREASRGVTMMSGVWSWLGGLPVVPPAAPFPAQLSVAGRSCSAGRSWPLGGPLAHNNELHTATVKERGLHLLVHHYGLPSPPWVLPGGMFGCPSHVATTITATPPYNHATKQ
jgi:hypothetical protein